ncbi:MAG: hypothetical protein VKJ46_03145 [Leptolyngbyaceae bacterium]|nr:hypothetical protein [Leptolyngbyaceae bacterium]
MEPQLEGKGLRIAAIAIIWAFATGMLAIAIPLVTVTKSDLIPLAIVLGVTIGTLGIWRTTAATASAISPSSMRQLQQRVTNLEVIFSHDSFSQESGKPLDLGVAKTEAEMVGDHRQVLPEKPE